jgi:hypothetical protein
MDAILSVTSVTCAHVWKKIKNLEVWMIFNYSKFCRHRSVGSEVESGDTDSMVISQAYFFY